MTTSTHPLEFTIHPDGRFDLRFGTLALCDCRPGIDDAAIHAQRIESTENRITYHLARGTLTLGFEPGKNGAPWQLTTELSGMAAAPHIVAPIFDARLDRAASFYHQGLGFGGPSGVTRLAVPATVQGRPLNVQEPDRTRERFPITSYVTAALLDESGRALTFGATDHRDFLQRSVVRRREYAYGLSNRRLSRLQFTLEILFETESIALPERRLTLPALQFHTAASAHDGLEALAREIGNAMECRGAAVNANAKPPTYHYCSWYHCDTSFDRSALEDLLHGLTVLPEKPRLDTIQIDASYFEHAGDWLEPSRSYPNGMREAAQRIHAAGYVPGIWVAPFMVGNRSRIAREHPDWLLRGLDGQPIRRWQSYLGRREWGLSDEEVLPLDTSHPDAFAFLREVFRTFRAWGFGFYKTDFMDWGLYDSGTVRRHTPGKTGLQYLRDVLRMIREEIGEESYWLGCILPFPPALGLVDGMRIGNDVPAVWSQASAGNMIQEMLCDQYFNNVWWQNDPDVLYLREFSTFLSRDQKESLALLAALSGGSLNTSDPIHELGPEGRQLWDFLEPTGQHFVGGVPDWERQVDTSFPTPLKRLTRIDSRGNLTLLLFNASTEPRTECVSFAESGLPGKSRAFVWSASGATPLADGQPTDQIVLRLAPHQSRLLYLSRDGSPPPKQLLANPAAESSAATRTPA